MIVATPAPLAVGSTQPAGYLCDYSGQDHHLPVRVIRASSYDEWFYARQQTAEPPTSLEVARVQGWSFYQIEIED